MMKVGAAEHPLAPTFEALEQIEAALDASLAQIYDAHRVSGLKLLELATIVTIAMNQARPQSAELESVAKHLFNGRITDDAVRLPIAELILALGWSPEDLRKKLEAEWGVEAAAGAKSEAA